MTGFQRLCLLTCVVVFGLIILGGVVRATDSGLGCGDDWPRCEGKLIPRFEKEVLIEYSHRLTASIAGLLVFGIVVWAWRSYRSVPAILYPSVLAFVLVLFQGGLGAAAVRNDLSPEIVALHLGTALTILALLVLVTLTAFDLTRPLAPQRLSSDFRRVAVLATITALALMLLGSYVSGAGYGLACNGWPLCNGDAIPTTDSSSVQLVFAHRFLALVLGLMLAALILLARRTRDRSPLAYRLAHIAFGLFCLQALLGAANVWTELTDEVRAAHLGLATLLWSLLVVLDIRALHLHELLPRTSGEGDKRNLIEAAR